ncbi:hypothetical protein CJF32_00005154 [Rutstroemia sp. NJR-2017a WRK4]|nr:hypothetical protein CJF32_00005154 [Rutstroemia sp. NJR-2017a WRK4]
MENQEHDVSVRLAESAQKAPSNKLLNIGACGVAPLNFDTQEMRFVVLAPHHGNSEMKLECTLSYEPLSEAKPYTAVVNTRGNPVGVVPILVNGKEILMPRNLSVFLLHMRAEDDHLRFWFRDLCLDVTNPEEKSRYWNDEWINKMNEHAQEIIDLSEIMAKLWDEGKLPAIPSPPLRGWRETRDLEEWKRTPKHHPAPLAVQNNPEGSSGPFTYLPLDYVMGEFRVFELWGSGNPSDPLKGMLAYTTRAEDIPYVCLSYTWGEEEPTEDMWLVGQRFKIRKRLADFFRTVRRENATFVIWIDAICIDQQNVAERNRQLPRMIDIYAAADMVVSWVGESDDASEVAIDVISELQTPVLRLRDDDNWDVKDSENFPRQLAALYRFLLRPYFRRIWVCQELAVSSSPVLFCGHRTVQWYKVDMAAYHLVDVLTRDKTMADAMIAADGQLKLVSENDVSFVRRLFYFRHLEGAGANSVSMLPVNPEWFGMGDKTPGILDVVVLARDFESTNPYDKIFAVWNLARDTVGMDFTMDYTRSLSQTYTEFAVAEAKHNRSLDIICAAEPTRNEELDMPSWVPDWSTPSTASSMIRREHIPNIFMSAVKNIGGPIHQAMGKGVKMSRFSFSDRVLKCPGLVVDKIKIVGPYDDTLTDKRGLYAAWLGIAVNESALYDWSNDSRSAFWSMIAGDVEGTWGFRRCDPTKMGIETAGRKTENERKDGNSSDKKEEGNKATDPQSERDVRKQEESKEETSNSLEAKERHENENNEREKNNDKKATNENQSDDSPKKDVTEGRSTEETSPKQEKLDPLLPNHPDSSTKEPSDEGYFTVQCYKPDELKHSQSKYHIGDIFGIVTKGRRLIVTEKGYIGLAPHWVKEQQSVAILSNCSTPVLLDEQSDGKYSFVGSCFVQGWMEGEYIERESEKAECADAEEFWYLVEIGGGQLEIV